MKKEVRVTDKKRGCAVIERGKFEDPLTFFLAKKRGMTLFRGQRCVLFLFVIYSY